MTRSHSLESLVRLAGHHRDQAARSMALARAAHQQARSQLETLVEYQGDYFSQLKAMLLEGTAGFALHDRRRFMDKIDEIIDQARKELERAEHDLRTRTSEWQRLQSRVEGIELLIAKRHAEKMKVLRKLEQRLTDEVGGRSRALVFST